MTQDGDRSRKADLYKALYRAFEEGLFVVGLGLIALGVQGILQFAGASPQIIGHVKASQRWLIIFTSAYIPARFWMSLVIDDIIAGVHLLRRFIKGFFDFLRTEYLAWKRVRSEARTNDREEDATERQSIQADDDD